MGVDPILQNGDATMPSSNV